jgi:hypothetical protein
MYTSRRQWRSYRTSFSLPMTGGLAVLLRDSQFLLRLPAFAMTEVCDFDAVLARAAKCQQKINLLVNSAYWDRTLLISLIN